MRRFIRKNIVPVTGITWDAAQQPTATTLSSGNTVASYNGVSTGNYATGYSTFGKSTGKWYVELVYGTSTGFKWAGIANAGIDHNQDLGADVHGWGWRSTNGNINHSGGNAGYGSSWAVGDVIGIALDMTNGNLFFSKNGTWQSTATSISIAAGLSTGAAATGLTGTIFIAWGGDPSNVTVITITQSAFAYTPPTGFIAFA